MRIKSITLNGFRNLNKTHLELPSDSKILSFVGPNGHGKTNVLESIFLLAISKSFRTNENEDFIRFDDDFTSLKLALEKGDEVTDLEIIVTRNPSKKILKVNGVQKKAVDFMGHLNVVFFSPDDMGMIHLSPSVRRRYLDLLISQIDRGYLEDSLKYQQIVRQRNSLLRRIELGHASPEELLFWDEQLAELGLRIIHSRRKTIEELSDIASALYRKVSGEKDELSLKYAPSVTAEDRSAYLNSLTSGQKRDLVTGSTHLGPHRDDLIFLCNGRDMKSFASRGEWRSLVLALKLAEIELLKTKKGHYPILLLDDVFSVLDDERQKVLFNIIKNTQTFITTTHKTFLEVVDGKKVIYEVAEGGIR